MRLVVGAPQYDDGLTLQQGAGYVFQKEISKRLDVINNEANRTFGNDVAVDGDIAVVGARFQKNGLNDEGAVYIYYRDTGGINNWGLVKTLSPQF